MARAGQLIELAAEELPLLWSVRLPRLLDPVVPPLADAMADGAWTAAWRRAGAFAPPVALLLGLLAGRLRPGMAGVYSESLPFLIVVVVGAILSGSAGVLLFLGYVVGDVLGSVAPGYPRYGTPLQLAGSQVIGYLLLALPAINLPALGRQLARSVAVRLPGRARDWLGVRAILEAGACGGLIFLWCQGMTVLIRPVFTWRGGSPPVQAIALVQHRWEVLVLAAVVAAVARVLLERAVVPILPGRALVAELRRRRGMGDLRRGELWRRLPRPVRAWLQVGVTVASTTFILAGAFDGWIDAVLVAAVTALLEMWRGGHLGSRGTRLTRWTRPTQRIPALLRFVAVAGVGYWLASLVVARFVGVPVIGGLLADRVVPLLWNGDGLRPITVGAVLTLVAYYLLLPSRGESRAGQGPPSARLGSR
jgi:hypothetical protein